MTMPILNMGLESPLADVYNDTSFHLMLETHLDWLRNHEETIVQPVMPNEAHKYQYDLYGFLKAHGVPDQVFWATMRCSAMTSPIEFGMNTKSLYIASSKGVDQLRQLYLTSLTTIGKK